MQLNIMRIFLLFIKKNKNILFYFYHLNKWLNCFFFLKPNNKGGFVMDCNHICEQCECSDACIATELEKREQNYYKMLSWLDDE